MANPPVASSPPSVPQGNLLTNPGFEIWQRGAGPFTASLGFGPDKWSAGLISGGSSITIAQDGTHQDVGSQNCASVVFVTTGGIVQFLQRFGSGENILAQLAGRIVTFSVRVNTTTANAMRLELWSSTQGASALAVSPTHPGDGLYHTLTVTALVPTGGTWFDVRTSALANCGAYFDNATLCVGPVALPYAPLHPADDLLRCQRYYERIGYPGDETLNWTGYMPGSNQAYAPIFYKVEKPVAPTYTIVGSWNFFNVSGSAFNGHAPGLTTANLAWLTNTAGIYTVYNQPGAYLTLEADP